MANGESPANRVLKGENPNKVFDSQEQFKDRNNLNNKKYQDGGSKNISGRTTESFGTRKIIASLIVLFVFVVLTMSLLMIKRKLMSNLLEGKNKSMKPFPYSKE